MAKKPCILIISPFFSPNTGGVETHLDDLTAKLDSLDYQVYVQAYSPITTPWVKWEGKEDRGNVHIKRYWWFGKNLFHRLERFPIADFFYLTPYLLARVFIFMFLNHKRIDLIHAQGINAAFIGSVIKKFYKKRLIVSIHAIYDIAPNTKVAFLIKKILSQADSLLTLSDASARQLLAMGIDRNTLQVYRYWIDLDVFKPLSDRETFRRELSLSAAFTVFFAGRLTRLKGVGELISVAQELPDINFVFAGAGPLSGMLKEKEAVMPNLRFLGRIDNSSMPRYYNMADVYCIPSQYNEGYGRVVMEAVACGLPVVGSKKGGISEALDETVSVLVEPTVENMAEAIRRLSEDRELYLRLKSNCRQFAQEKFSERNARVILSAYEHN